MKLELSAKHRELRDDFRAFVDQEIVPVADENDRVGCTPPELIGKLAERGYLGAVIPESYGGSEMDMLAFGLLAEEIGRGSGSLLSLITVHGMLSLAIVKWSEDNIKKQWLSKLATGEAIGAFGLTEPQVGSDAKSVQTTAVRDGQDFILTGTKRWISFGQIADLFLIVAQCEGKPTAFLVERDRPGFNTHPITGLYAFKSAMLAELELAECRIPQENLLGRIGFGFSHVAGSVLDYGRYCVGCGCVGMAQACLEASQEYTTQRWQGGKYLQDHQLIQQMISEMITGIEAARLLCRKAGYHKDNNDPDSIMESSIAKHFSATMVNKVAADAFQIHGANACGDVYPLQRYLRDAKVMEIIEGSSQIQHLIISKYGYQKFNQDRMTDS